MKIYEGSRSDEWGTPRDLLDALGLKADRLDVLDVCASADNHKFPGYWTKEDDCLSRDWPKEQWIWMNPPFSQAHAFFKKAVKEAARGCWIVCIYKASNMETKTWQELILPHASSILILKGRTNYVTGAERSDNVPFGSAIIYFNAVPLQLSKNLGHLFYLRM